jgi:hypothetical protein
LRFREAMQEIIVGRNPPPYGFRTRTGASTECAVQAWTAAIVFIEVALSARCRAFVVLPLCQFCQGRRTRIVNTHILPLSPNLTSRRVLPFLRPQIIEDGGAQEDFSALSAARFDQGPAGLLAQLALELAFSIKLGSHDPAFCICALLPPASNPRAWGWRKLSRILNR